MVYIKETNTYTCGRCKRVGFPSVYNFPNEPDVCTACANHLRFGDIDFLDWKIPGKIKREEERTMKKEVDLLELEELAKERDKKKKKLESLLSLESKIHLFIDYLVSKKIEHLLSKN